MTSYTLESSCVKTCFIERTSFFNPTEILCILTVSTHNYRRVIQDPVKWVSRQADLVFFGTITQKAFFICLYRRGIGLLESPSGTHLISLFFKGFCSHLLQSLSSGSQKNRFIFSICKSKRCLICILCSKCPPPPVLFLQL